MTLSNKTVIVTGASSGIGAACARLFAREGANVVIGARRETHLRDIAAEIAASGGNVAHLAGDVRDEAFAHALVDLSTDRFGALHGALNNAGITGPALPIPKLSVEDWNAVMETNLTSAFYGARHQVPAILESGGGSVVFTSSFVGQTVGLPGMGAYAAAKAGLVGLAQVLAVEHGAQGLRANTLMPGGTLTEMAGDDTGFHEFVRGLHALKRMAAPEEIAEAALFLISDRGSFVTGTSLYADGGNSVCKT